MSFMNQGIRVVCFAAVLGCTSTTTRPDDAFEPSPDSTADAGVDAFTPDVPNFDAFSPDAPGGTDAFSPDAFNPMPEICNGQDDDLDSRYDEDQPGWACSNAVNGFGATCERAECVCPRWGVHPTAVWRGDCNHDFADGCEAMLGTDTDCRGCGDACDLASQCRLREGVGYACGPADIGDFTLARDDGQIACFSRGGERPGLVCRGPNSSYALSDSEPEGAVLGWTIVDLPTSRWSGFRAWRHIRPDGRDVMTICARNERGMFCRGDDSTGLVQREPGGDLHGYRQVFAIDAEHFIGDFSIWHGQGVMAVAEQYHLPTEIRVWGGPEAPTTVRRLPIGLARRRAVGFAVGDQVLAWQSGDVSGITPLFSWGPQRSFLGGSGWVDVPGEDLPLVLARQVNGVACSRDVCCGDGDGGEVACWGHRPSESDVFTRLMRSPYDISTPLTLVPQRDGHVFVCAETIVSELVCADATAAIEGGEVAFTTTHPFNPSRHTHRPDQGAFCSVNRSDWWQCWGTHDGWGHE